MAYILEPPSAPLTPAPALHLLPFALHPLPSTAAVGRYFVPRAAPADAPGLAPGTPLAAFRGRQVVGHAVAVPTGYRGVVLDAPVWSGAGRASGERQDRGGAAAGAAPARARGTGQTARAKPRTRRAAVRRAYALGSDDEDDAAGAGGAPTRAAGKRARLRTPSPEPAAAPGLPRIAVISATPVKLSTAASTASVASIADTLVDEPEPLEEGGSVDAASAQLGDDTPSVGPEAIIPSPATEDDPPTFAVARAAPARAAADDDAGAPATETETDAARVLRPVHTFDSFTLWTPDVPIPGWGAGATGGADEAAPADARDGGDAGAGAGAGGAGADEASAGVAHGTLRPGAWAAAGSGEGGDEFVRGLGEWLGLVRVLNTPVVEAGDDDDDDDGDD